MRPTVLGLPADEDEVIVRREIHTSGKGRASVNGALVPANVLRDLSRAPGGHPRPARAAGPARPGHPPGRGGPARGDRPGPRPARRTGGCATSRRSSRRSGTTGARGSAAARCSSSRRARSRRPACVVGKRRSRRAEKVVQANAGHLAELARDAYAMLYEEDDAALARLRQVYRKVEDLSRIDRRFQAHLEGRDAVTAPLEDLSLFLRDYQEGPAGHSRPARRDRSAPGLDRAAEAEVWGDRGGGARLRRALPHGAAAAGVARGGGTRAGRQERAAAAQVYLERAARALEEAPRGREGPREEGRIPAGAPRHGEDALPASASTRTSRWATPRTPRAGPSAASSRPTSSLAEYRRGAAILARIASGVSSRGSCSP